VFLGTHQPRLDDKGRLFLPARFREELAEGLVITKGQDRCLYGFPLSEWNRITDQMAEAPLTAKAARDFSRMFFSGASHEVPDKQGRVTVPAALRQYAGLTRDCVVTGVQNRIEVWDQSAWDAFIAAQEQAYADLTEEVLPGVM
jgi:MraZ protein